MNLRVKLGVTMLVLAFVFASAYIADAGMGGGMVQQIGYDTDRGTGGDRDVSSSGATRVDADLYPFHYGDVNQFGDDEAYNSATGRNNIKVPYPVHREDF